MYMYIYIYIYIYIYVYMFIYEYILPYVYNHTLRDLLFPFLLYQIVVDISFSEFSISIDMTHRYL